MELCEHIRYFMNSLMDSIYEREIYMNRYIILI